MSYTIEHLSEHLFWDVNKNLLDLEKSKEQIIYKVLEFGKIQDWQIIQEIYGLETIKKLYQKLLIMITLMKKVCSTMVI